MHAFNFFNPGTGALIRFGFTSTPSYNTALPGAGGFAPDGIDNLIVPQAQTFNTLPNSFFRLSMRRSSMSSSQLSPKR